MPKMIQQTIKFDGVSPEELFEIYMDSKKHATAIGSEAFSSRKVGGTFKAFSEDGLKGKNLAIIPNRMIVQSWRAQPWKESDLDSILTLTFSKVSGGAQIDLAQVNIPDHAYSMINEEAWNERYWKPWKAYLKQRSTKR